MKRPFKAVLITLSALGALVADISTRSPWRVDFMPEAAAVIGRPWTPISYAGVARRTTRRAVWAGSAAAASTAAASTPTTVIVTTPAPSGSSVPVGTVVTTLPAGCTKITLDGVQYHNCAGVYYRAGFQGNNVVYVVSQP